MRLKQKTPRKIGFKTKERNGFLNYLTKYIKEYKQEKKKKERIM
jgi:hypothetical protein